MNTETVTENVSWSPSDADSSPCSSLKHGSHPRRPTAAATSSDIPGDGWRPTPPSTVPPTATRRRRKTEEVKRCLRPRLSVRDAQQGEQQEISPPSQLLAALIGRCSVVISENSQFYHPGLVPRRTDGNTPLTSESPVCSLDSPPDPRASEHLKPSGRSCSGPVLSGGMNWTAEWRTA